MFEQENWPNVATNQTTNNNSSNTKKSVPENNTSNLKIFPKLTSQYSHRTFYTCCTSNIPFFDSFSVCDQRAFAFAYACAYLCYSSNPVFVHFHAIISQFMLKLLYIFDTHWTDGIPLRRPFAPPFIWATNVSSNRYLVKPIVMEMKLFEILKYCCVCVWQYECMCCVCLWMFYTSNNSRKKGCIKFCKSLSLSLSYHLSALLICASKITNNFEWFNPAKGQKIAINFPFIVLKHFIGSSLFQPLYNVRNGYSVAAIHFNSCRHCQRHTIKTQFQNKEEEKTSCFINDDHSICKIRKE